jgi:hypothetical protein
LISSADVLPFLEHSSWAVHIRQSTWLYPFLEIVHITGIVVVVGPAIMFDLRLLGVSRHLSIVDLKNHLLPWSMRGLFLVIPSGILLFMTNAIALADDRVFWLKMVLLLFAGLNAMLFRFFVYESPMATKVVAVASLMLWISIIACGRLLAY